MAEEHSTNRLPRWVALLIAVALGLYIVHELREAGERREKETQDLQQAIDDAKKLHR